MISPSCRFVALVACALGPGSSATGADPVVDRSWVTPGGGNFAQSSNWSGGVAPGPGDRAIFDLGGAHTIQFTTNPTNHLARVADDTWTWTLSGRTYTLTSGGYDFDAMSMQVGSGAGDFASLMIDGPGTVEGNMMVVGVAGGSTGLVQVRGGANLVADNLYLAGSGGTGSLFVTAGSTVQTTIIEGSEWGDSALAITGGGHVEASHLATFGRLGDASIEVLNGTFTAETVLGETADGTCDVIVRGASAHWSSYILTVGAEGASTFLVDDGAHVDVNTGLYVAARSGSTGLLRIPDSTTASADAGWLSIGGEAETPGGDGTVEIGPGGDVTVEYNTTVYPDGTLTLNGGVLDTRNLLLDEPGAGTVNFTSGEIHVHTFTFDINEDAAVGGHVTLTPARLLTSTNTIRVSDTLPGFAYVDLNDGVCRTHTIWYGTEAGDRGESYISGASSLLEVDAVMAIGGTAAAGGEGYVRVISGGARVDLLTLVWPGGQLDVEPGGAFFETRTLGIKGGLVQVEGSMLVTSDLFGTLVDGILIDGLEPSGIEMTGGELYASRLDIATFGGGQGVFIVEGEDGTEPVVMIDGPIYVGSVDSSATHALLQVGAGAVVQTDTVVDLTPDATLTLDGGTLIAAVGSRGQFNPQGGIIDGSLNLLPEGTTSAWLRGVGLANSDRVDVNGPTVLGGALDVRVEDGATASPGDTGVLLQASSITGAFDDITVDSSAIAPLRIAVTVNDTQVRYEVLHTADVNGDGVVDVADLLAVLAAWGSCSGCPEDIDGSGAVDVGDLLAVLAGWGG